MAVSALKNLWQFGELKFLWGDPVRDRIPIDRWIMACRQSSVSLLMDDWIGLGPVAHAGGPARSQEIRQNEPNSARMAVCGGCTPGQVVTNEAITGRNTRRGQISKTKPLAIWRGFVDYAAPVCMVG